MQVLLFRDVRDLASDGQGSSHYGGGVGSSGREITI